MYKDYFGFKEDPFSIAPDPQFLYMSERHREALAHLIYGMKADSGFVLLTGEVGTGKTTVCRCLLGQIPENSDIAFILNPKLSVLDLLATICDELKISYSAEQISVKVLVDQLNRFLLGAHSQGRQTVLIIDEAQNLSTDVLEQIRLLTNLETDKHKLLQVIMLGQPELNHMLDRPELRQLAQRITARYHLEPLARDELDGYLNHRLAVAGVERPLFSSAAINKLYNLTDGVPRLINLLCDRALLGAYVKGQSSISPDLLKEAASEVFGRRDTPRQGSNRALQWTNVVLLSLILVVCTVFVVAFIRSSPVAPDENNVVAEKRVVVEKKSPVEIKPLQWDSDQPLENSSLIAYQTLFHLWGEEQVNLDQGARAVADGEGLELVTKRASLGRLKQLNLPAVLKIRGRNGQNFYVTLTHLADDMATVAVDQNLRRIPVSQLMDQWFGDYGLLWKPPNGYDGAIKPGQVSPLIPWLEQTMANVFGRSARKMTNMTLEGQLLEEIIEFQNTSGLVADGVVGSHTLILLTSRIDNGQPALNR